MDKINIKDCREYAELPFQAFEAIESSVYVLDKEWHCLYVNKFVKKLFKATDSDFIGKQLWQQFPVLLTDPDYVTLKKNSEDGRSTILNTTSPLSGQRVNIIAHVFSDCYVFFSTQLPDKSKLLSELKSEMSKQENKKPAAPLS